MKIDKWSKMVNEQNKIPLFVRQKENKTEKVFSLKDCENGHSVHMMNNLGICYFDDFQYIPHLSLQQAATVLLGNI